MKFSSKTVSKYNVTSMAYSILGGGSNLDRHGVDNSHLRGEYIVSKSGSNPLLLSIQYLHYKKRPQPNVIILLETLG